MRERHAVGMQPVRHAVVIDDAQDVTDVRRHSLPGGVPWATAGPGRDMELHNPRPRRLRSIQPELSAQDLRRRLPELDRARREYRVDVVIDLDVHLTQLATKNARQRLVGRNRLRREVLDDVPVDPDRLHTQAIIAEPAERAQPARPSRYSSGCDSVRLRRAPST